MAGLTDLEQNIARLEEATAAARDATSEARAALKDLKQVKHEIEAMLGKRSIKERVDEAFAPILKEGLESIREQMKKAAHDSYDRVQSQIDILINLCLGKPGAVGKNKEDLRPVIAEKLREWIVDELKKR